MELGSRGGCSVYRPGMIMIDGPAGERNFVVALEADKKEKYLTFYIYIHFKGDESRNGNFFKAQISLFLSCLYRVLNKKSRNLK